MPKRKLTDAESAEEQEYRKATQAEMERRTNEAYGLIMSGATRAQIHDHAVKKEWACETRQIDECIKRARELLKVETAAEREERLTLARARLNHLYAKAITMTDYKTALAVLREINQLESLYAPPAINTLKLELAGTDPQLLIEVLRAMQTRNMNASEIFHAMLAEIAAMPPEGDSDGSA